MTPLLTGIVNVLQLTEIIIHCSDTVFFQWQPVLLQQFTKTTSPGTHYPA